MILDMFIASAFAAETLPAVSPPTDWTGVGIVMLFGLVIVLGTGYVIYAKLKAGNQFGEEFIDQVADKLHAKMNPPAAPVAGPLTFDGRTFTSEADLAEYKAAQAVLAKFPTGAKP